MTACSEDAEQQPVRLEQGRSSSSAAMFGQEGDVVFEVGPPNGQTWRLTAHSQVLCENNDVMKAELVGPMAVARSSGNITHIRVEDVDPRAFRCLLRFLYGLPPQLQSVNTALATIYAAHKYICADLEWECAAFLNEHVQKSPPDALDVLQGANYFCLQRDVWLPTAPPAEDVDSDVEEGASLMRQISSDSQTPIISPPARPSSWQSDDERRMGEACRRLKYNCLQVIDQHADDILGLEQFEDLDQELMLAVTSRDTFAVSSELLVLIAVERWAECECKRRKLPHDSRFLREACGGQEMICSGQLARLLLLSPKQFINVPLRSPLLTQDEQRSLLTHLVDCKGRSNPNSPSHMAWSQLAKPRTPQPPKYLPIPASQKLGSRLPQHVACETETTRRHRRWKLPWSRVNRRKSKENRQPKVLPEPRRATTPPPANDRPSTPSCCSKTCEVFLMVVACLFD